MSYAETARDRLTSVREGTGVRKGVDKEALCKLCLGEEFILWGVMNDRSVLLREEADSTDSTARKDGMEKVKMACRD